MDLSALLAKIMGKKPAQPREQVLRAFKRRYVSFKDLLQSNTDLANILASIDAALRGRTPINESQVRAEATKAVFHTMRMVTSINTIAAHRYSSLIAVVEAINKRIMAELDDRPPLEVHDLTLPMAALSAELSMAVGGKSANLGELGNVLRLPVPRGFAITTAAQEAFMGPELMEEVRKILRNADPALPASIAQVAEEIERRMLDASMPEELEAALLQQWDAAFGLEEAEAPLMAALRSSAVAEDGVHTFAGQYKTVLGVRRDTLSHAFREVLASLYSPRAITYRLSHGYTQEASMAMCCQEMVLANAAGVAFSRHPVDLCSDAVLINGLWGLGELLVDGEAPSDAWLVRRGDLAIVEHTAAHKNIRLNLEVRDGRVVSARHAVAPELRDAFCLSDAQARDIASMVLRLEEHYQYPQDMEWAVDGNGRMFLLQSRPMHMPDGCRGGMRRDAPVEGARILLDGGDVAAKGVGCGPVCHVETKADLERFPAGGVLVTRHSSPNMVVAMERAVAIVAETGSLTGHMASVCREFNLPTLLNIAGATNLPEGEVVTVDAISARVYAGEVTELTSRHRSEAPVEKTPVLALLQRVAKHITPLHLIDPKSALFTPEHCTSLHDVMRYVHEQSYTEMFRLSDSASDAGAVAVRLRCAVPLDLYIIDLGGGLQNPDAPFVTPQEVTSIPFGKLLGGMLLPDVQAREPRPVNMQGFLAVMSQSMIGGNQGAGERFGDRSYAIISDHYCNFSSRVGYHYAIMDAWCDDTMNKNYITFKFAGGAADEIRRERRVRSIGLILQRLGFTVEVVMDRVQARFQKYPRADVEERLDQLGRLLIMTRQMDMLMVNEDSVQLFAEKFLRGDYH